jgi:hypothetical protein
MQTKTRFVIHKHTQEGRVHWDLMIELGDKLKTWRLENPPEKLATQTTKATLIFDHDKKFLTYQGSVKGGRGTVEIVDEGICTIELTTENEIKINFVGKILNNQFSLLLQNDYWLLERST